MMADTQKFTQTAINADTDIFLNCTIELDPGCLNARAELESRQVYEVPTDIQALSDFKQKLLTGKPRTNAVSS